MLRGMAGLVFLPPQSRKDHSAMDRLTIEAKGSSPADVRITIAGTGASVEKLIPVRAVTISLQAGELNRATVEIVPPMMLIENVPARYLLRHPSGGLREVARIEFRDGASYDFPASNTLPAEE